MKKTINQTEVKYRVTEPDGNVLEVYTLPKTQKRMNEMLKEGYKFEEIGIRRLFRRV